MDFEKKQSLLCIIHGLPVGGAEKMLVNLVNRIDKAKFTIKIVSLSNKNPLATQIQADAVQIIPVPRRWQYDMQPAINIRKIILENRVDTILAFDMFSFFYIWYSLPGIKERPQIYISIHHTLDTTIFAWLKNFLYARLLSGKEQFISVCNNQAVYWAKNYFIPRQQFTTIYNGVDTELFSPDPYLNNRIQIRENYHIPENAAVIVQVASLASHKRHEDSIIAFKLLKDRNLNYPKFLFLIGDGSKERQQKLQKLVFDLDLSGSVLFLGHQNNVKPFYDASDVFTLTSNSETFSIAALEAMSMGLPCVLTNIGGANEMIVEGENGYLTQPQDPQDIAERWLKILENKKQFNPEKIREKVVENFSIQTCVKKYEQILMGCKLD